MIGAIVTAAIGILMVDVAVGGASRILHIPLRDNGMLLAFLLVLQDLIVVSTAWIFGLGKYHLMWDRFGFRSFRAATGCTMSVALLMGSYVVRALYGLIAFAFGYRITEQAVLTQLDLRGIGFLTSFVAVAVVAPIAEETFFRGFLYGGLRKRIGIVGAMLVSTAFFTALHLSLELFVPIFVLGLFLAWLYEYTGSLYPGIMLHAANNAISLLLLLLVQQSGLLLK